MKLMRYICSETCEIVSNQFGNWTSVSLIDWTTEWDLFVNKDRK